MNEPQNSAGVAKLFAPPFKTYVESAEKDKKTGKIIKTRFTCWLHPLTDKEQLSVEAVAAENLRAAVKEQLNDNDCWYRRNRAYICQRLFYSVRTGSVADRPGVPGSPRLFDERMVVGLSHEESTQLSMEYKTAFEPTEEERKNYFRERLGEGSETSSTSPRGTAFKRFSRKGR